VRKAIFGLGFFLIAAACSGSQTDSDSEPGSAAASAGEDSSSGGSGPTGGTSKGGGSGSAGDTATGGDESGGSDAGGAAQGGATTGGSGGGGASQSGGTSGTAGSASGGVAAMATAGSSGLGGGGTGGSGITDPVCDPSEGDLDNTPYPDCEPREASDACELCIQSSCCEESKVCYGFDPANVCGWGGPTPSPYATVGEVDCYVRCARAYVEETGVYDDSAADLCVPACTTAGCGLIGNATQDLIVCMEASCEDECFAP
jgi:hypothetical protein